MATKKPVSRAKAAAKKAKPAAKPVAPDKRRRQNITTMGKRAPAAEIDAAFLSEADMQKRERFAQAYVAHGKLADAAVEVGYKGSRKTLRTQGLRLYNEPWVKARVAEINADLLSELRITQRKVLGEMARIAFADIGDISDEHGEILPMSKIPMETRRALSSYKTKRMTFGEDGESVEREVKFESKLAALEKLGKHAGLFGRAEDDAPGIAADDFMRALGEGIARVIAGKRSIADKP